MDFRARTGAGAGFSPTYRRAAHATAHPWLGHLLGYELPGENAFLFESPTKYAGLVLIDPQARQDM